jgi:hypothetical protein
MIIAGNYNLTFSAPGYYSKTVQNVSAVNDQATVLNVKLMPILNGLPGNTNIPGEFRLYQNYPNPFNPVTTIRFDIPLLNLPLSGGDLEGVNLTIYNILGNEIAILANGKLAPGTYEYTWDASAFPSGVYFYKLNAGDFTAVNKMILIK